MIYLKPINILVFITSYFFVAIYSITFRCGQDISVYENIPTQYYFLMPCYKSKLKIIYSKNVSSLAACQELANRKKGYAINFADGEFLHPSSKKNFTDDNCLIYDCPEFEFISVLTELEVSPAYDYYTSIARIMPSVNITCIPQIGIFHIHLEKQNYTNAQNICITEGGKLADVSNEIRTNNLLNLIQNFRLSQVYIGMDELTLPNTFVTINQMPLNCLKFRPWLPGEPRYIKNNAKRCTTLHTKGGWAAVKCGIRLPFLCEFNNFGPYEPCNNITSPWKLKECKNKFAKSQPHKNRNPKCGTPKKSLIPTIPQKKKEKPIPKRKKPEEKGNRNRKKPNRKNRGRNRENKKHYGETTERDIE